MELKCDCGGCEYRKKNKKIDIKIIEGDFVSIAISNESGKYTAPRIIIKLDKLKKAVKNLK